MQKGGALKEPPMYNLLFKLKRIILASRQFLEVHCESNPELNMYIKKPKFSRDPFDYDPQRTGYSQLNLV